MNMNSVAKTALLNLTVMLLVLQPARATLTVYHDSDLMLGIRATGGTGATSDYLIDLGQASLFNQTRTLNLGDMGADLSSVFGASWYSRSDLLFAVVGGSITDNTLYSTNPSATPWKNQFSQGDGGSLIDSLGTNYTNLVATANSNGLGIIQATSSDNSYASFQPGGTFVNSAGISFSTWNPTNEGLVASALNFNKLTEGNANASLLLGSFSIDSSGQVTFTAAGAPVVPSVHFELSNYSVSEAVASGKVSIKIIRETETTTAFSVNFSTSNGTAAAGTDFTGQTDTPVSFLSGETEKTVTVDVANLAGYKGDRAFTVGLSGATAGATITTPGTATVTIQENDPAPTPAKLAFSSSSFSFAPANSDGNPSTMNVTLSRTDSSSGAVSADVSVAAGGTLVNGTDFDTFNATTANFADAVNTATVFIHLKNKKAGTINLQLSNPQNGAILGTATTATVTVTAVDLLAPTLLVATPKAGAVTASFDVTGTASDNLGIDRVEIKLNGVTTLATVGAFSAGKASFTATGLHPENGANTLIVQSVDKQGNKSAPVTMLLTFANSRPALAGVYNGLLVPTAALPDNNKTGLVNLMVGVTGLVTGKVNIGGFSIIISGVVANDGAILFNPTHARTLALVGTPKLPAPPVPFGTLALAVGANKVTGTLTSAPNSIANLDGDRAFFSKTVMVDPKYLKNKGTYTVVFPARATQVGLAKSGYPQGDGIGTITVAATGIVTLIGTLADGTPITAAAPLSQDLKWPCFAQLYLGKGCVAGKATLDDSQPDSDLKGTDFLWIRPATGAAYYAVGWPNGILTDLLASEYLLPPKTPAASVFPGLGATNPATGNAAIVFDDGKLTGPVSKNVNINTANTVTNAPTTDTSFGLKLTSATGQIAGTFTHTDSTKPAYKATIFQKGPNKGAYGFFLSTVPVGGSGESGGVTLLAK